LRPFPDQTREVWDIGFLEGGKFMLTVGTLSGAPDDAHIKVWDFATRQAIRTPVPNGSFVGARCLALSPDGKHLAVGSNTGPVKVLDTTSWQEVLNIPDIANTTFRVDFARNGNHLLIASGEGAAIAIRLPWAK
jgi:WD40 repeat protein